MLKGSTKMQIAGAIGMLDSLIVMIYTFYLLYDYKTSPFKAAYDSINENYMLIMIMMIAFQLYMFVVSVNAFKKADYSESAIPIMVNGIILTIISGVWLIFAIGSYSKTSDLHFLISGYKEPGTMEMLFISAMGLEIVCSLLLAVSGMQNKAKTVIVNSWGETKYNTPPAYPQQPQYPQQQYYEDQNGYADQYYQNDSYTQQEYYDDGQYYEQPQEYYDDSQYYEQPQEYYDDGQYYEQPQEYTQQ